YVGDDERQLDGEREPDRLGLEVHARPARRRDGDRAAERRTERRADARDLVLRLEGDGVELLQRRELVQDVARRRDRVAAEEEGTAGLVRRRDEAERRRRVAGDVAVHAGRDARGLDLVRDLEEVGVLGEVVARAERADVRLDELGRLL